MPGQVSATVWRMQVSLSTALLTELSDCAAKDDWEGFRGYIAKGLRSTFFLIIPLACMVGALAIPLMQLFQAGAFSSDDAQFVGNILATWTLSLPFYAGYMYMYRVFAAMRKFLQFALIDFALRIPQVFFYWYLCIQPTIGLAGIPLTDLAFYGIMFVIWPFDCKIKSRIIWNPRHHKCFCPLRSCVPCCWHSCLFYCWHHSSNTSHNRKLRYSLCSGHHHSMRPRWPRDCLWLYVGYCAFLSLAF